MFKKVIFFVIFIIVVKSSAISEPLKTESHDRPDTIVRLSYYSKPVTHLEWSVTVYRRGSVAYVQIENFRSHTQKRSIDPRRYQSFVDIMDREHLLNIEKSDVIAEGSCFYEIFYQYRGVTRVVRIDPFISHMGKKRGVPVIIRTLTNYGVLILSD
ncbi:MAG: hypothetical protein PF637_02995 [Spirochaetes bacterium]|nr:hypothetical protein [Spirochaetota bacterium]